VSEGVFWNLSAGFLLESLIPTSIEEIKMALKLLTAFITYLDRSDKLDLDHDDISKFELLTHEMMPSIYTVRIRTLIRNG